MNFGLALPHYDASFEGARASWRAVRGIAELAESSGFDSLWVSDHLFLDWARYGAAGAQGSLECWTTMSALAGVTSKVRIGSLVLCNDFRHPSLTAKMAATLDLLSGGRLELGMGAGWHEPEYRAAGITFSTPARRIDRLGEAVGIVCRLLGGEEVSFKGRHYSLSGAICRPLPAQRPRPRVWIGGKGDRVLRRAAEVADGWNFSWLGSTEAYGQRLDALERACERVGRDPATLSRSVGVHLLAGKDPADARRRFERLGRRTPKGVMHRLGEGRAVSWEAFRRQRVAGTVAEVVDKLGKLVDLGVEEAILSLGAMPFQVADAEDVEFVGTEVVSQLR